MAERSYTVPLTGVVTVDAEKNTVKVEVDLTDLPTDLKHDYDKEYPTPEAREDEKVITDFMMASPGYHFMHTTMGE